MCKKSSIYYTYKKKLIVLGAALLSLSCFAGCVKGDRENDGANIQVGDVLPDFSVDMNDGGVVNSGSLTGKISVILFFSVTCPDCQSQFPAIEQIYREYKDNENFILVGISRAEGESVAGKYLRDNNYTFPYSAQETSHVYSLFAQSVIPRIYISDRSRVVQKMFTDRPVATYNELKTEIERLLN